MRRTVCCFPLFPAVKEEGLWVSSSVFCGASPFDTGNCWEFDPVGVSLLAVIASQGGWLSTMVLDSVEQTIRRFCYGIFTGYGLEFEGRVRL